MYYENFTLISTQDFYRIIGRILIDDFVTWMNFIVLFQAGSIRNSDIAKELCLPPVKLHCSMLAEDAIKAALKDYKVKKERKTEWT